MIAIGPVVLAFGTGLMLGFAHFATLGMALTRYADGRMYQGLAIHGLRLVIVGAVLLTLARAGLTLLLASVLGLALSRMIVLARTP